jgi:dTDP-4-dehydrorhamnose 3,5-epimerase
VKLARTELPGVLLLEPAVAGDARGSFMETYRAERYRELGLSDLSAQDNLSHSRRGVLRGLHLQNPHAQAKLCQVLVGEIYDVVVDLRRGSPAFGRWQGFRLSADQPQQLYVPEGVAHGFCVVSEEALFYYKCSERYEPSAELVLRWDDPELAIDWPVAEPLLSARDAAGALLRELPLARLPVYSGSS